MDSFFSDMTGFSRKKIGDLIEYHDSINGENRVVAILRTTVLCDIKQHNECKNNNICMKFWRDGRMFRHKELAKILVKKIEALNIDDEIMGCYLEERAFKECKHILFKVESQDEQKTEEDS